MVKIIPQLLSNLLKIDVLVVHEDNLDELDYFEKKYSFYDISQPILSKEFLTKQISLMEERCLYEIVSKLNVRLFCFPFQGQTFILGPYLNKYMTDEDLMRVLVKIRGEERSILSLRNYYANFTITDGITINKTIEAVLTTFYSNLDFDYAYHRINDTMEHHSPNLPKTHLSVDEIYQKYNLENQFLNNIKTGNVQKIEESYAHLIELAESNTYNLYISNNNQIPLSALRTLVRKAAEQSGLSVAIIESIVQNYTQLMTNSQDKRKSSKYIHEFILDMTKAVAEHLSYASQYSYYTTRAIDYLQVHYNESVLLEAMADELHLSPSHLEHTFKRDTGITIKQYIAKIRCQKAMELLKTTNFSVSQIGYIVGYEDPNYFTKVFKNACQITPEEFRSKERR